MYMYINIVCLLSVTKVLSDLDCCSPWTVFIRNFADFIPNVHDGIFSNKYDFTLFHFNPNITDGIEEYKRRINRFNFIINEPKKFYFIYINEDYLYDKSYREEEFNDGIFKDMLDLEKFIKDKYINIDYNILYFNFKHHNIPTNSNIINVVLHSDNLYDNTDGSPYEELRIYCGKVLTNLFNTDLILGYDNSIFIN